ncbi:MAG: hypothetical protein H0U34_06725 [Sphingomonas sp.]|nr:hypothetical protein [Sphingomonas sp.]
MTISALLAGAPAAVAPPPSVPVERRIGAPEAGQGAASDGRFVYAIDNQRIGKYEIASGRRVAAWSGDPKRFPHLNSCTMVAAELVCAMSNYPAVPQASSVEFFDPASMRHLRSVSLGLGPGSLTVIDRHRGQWWAVFANYDGRGGQPGRDHRSTLLVRMDDQFRQLEAWTFPQSVLSRLAPRSASGASWTADGRLTVSGHDLPEIYVLSLPPAGPVLDHVATVPAATPGQAIDWDPADAGRLWSIDRARAELVASRPKLP